MHEYLPRVVDAELDELLDELPAIALEGPRGVGKTETALRRARSVFRLDDAARRAVVEADVTQVLRSERPILLDEWQRVPGTWDVVRRAVDEDSSPGQFLLTGSATPLTPPTHSGAGRIVTVRMRPMSLHERRVENPTVSLGAMLSGSHLEIEGETSVDLATYTHEIVASGFPGLRHLSARALRAQLDGYVRRIVDHDFEELGRPVRRPATLRRWMTAYAAATGTTTTFETIRSAATGGQGNKPAKTTVLPYRDILDRLWIIDPVPAWLPTRSAIARLARPPKHNLADPALAARLLGLGADALLGGESVTFPMQRGRTLLGNLFESLVTLSVRVFARESEARVGHLRTKEGRREVDLIVERSDGRVIGIEVKLGREVGDRDVRHLLWLKEQLGPALLDSMVIHTGPNAFRRPDGVAVVPAALLGP